MYFVIGIFVMWNYFYVWIDSITLLITVPSYGYGDHKCM